MTTAKLYQAYLKCCKAANEAEDRGDLLLAEAWRCEAWHWLKLAALRTAAIFGFACALVVVMAFGL